MSDYKKTLPNIDEDSRPFWDAAKRHELVLHQCKICGQVAAVQFPIGGTGCLEHGDADMEWVKASGKGTLFSFIIVNQTFDPAFNAETPYNVSVIELEEGPLLTSNVVDCKNEDLKIDMPVDVTFEDVTEEVSLPKFRRVEC